jgi:hypothetical protein
MISFRFHLVSLVAVFLALGLGVLTGTTVLNRGIVMQLERQTDQLAEQSNALREQVTDLQRQSEGATAFGGELRDYVVPDRLAGIRVVVVTQEGTDDAALGGLRRVLDQAGAELLALLSADQPMSLDRPADRAALAEIVGLPADAEPDDLEGRVAAMLADRLEFGAGQTDVLMDLLQGGFLVNRGPALGEQSLGELDDADAVVVVTGGPGPPIVPPSAFLIPLVDRLSVSGSAVAAGETTETDYPFVQLLRRDGAIAERIVTQDNVDQIFGEVGLVLALEDLLASGRAGHYGVKEGAGSVVPPA